ncbi:MAG: dihydroorotate dehydrogenase electron transfer subunit [Bacilli bacterium]|nr:dihydroorotate dehydrogenase electron transfer subunit [Bacilli bacterium]
MKNVILKIEKNIQVGKDIFLMRLVGDTSEIKKPGEFIEIKLPDYYLRRPISVCDYSENYVDILYKVLGFGTKDMSNYPVGMSLDVLIGLGNGFNLNDKKPVLIGGGIGIAPMFALLKKYNEKGLKPELVYGARSKDDLVLIDELEKYAKVYLCTDDGSIGFKGNVIECIKHNNIDIEYYHACGPQIMLKFLAKAYPNGEVSLEARMGCGFGACMGCSIETTNGPKRVCKEGPVFNANEVIF